MLFDLLNAGILSDADGKLSVASKAKVLSLMGFGNWENAQDIAQLHIARAGKENVDIDHAEILEVDDHEIHIEQHTRFVIANTTENFDEVYREKVLAHIRAHKAALKAAQSDNKVD